MRVSELTEADVVKFLKLDGTEGDISPSVLLAAAKDYIRGETDLLDDEIDRHEDLTIAALVLCAELYENRMLTVESAHENRTVETILGRYRMNLV